MTKKPLIVIVGETASGKTAVSIELAQKIQGEIICADSKTIYKGMDIGTAKPTKDEMNGIPHYCLDLVEPDQSFTVVDFQLIAKKIIADIKSRNKIPILVGGSGLYVDSIIYDYQFGEQADQKTREELSRKSIEALQNICRQNNYDLPENKNNKRYLIRQIETKGKKVKNTTLIDNIILVGIFNNRSDLKQRIKLRIEKMMADGLLVETKELFDKYHSNEALKANIYQISMLYLQHKISYQEMIDLAIKKDLLLSKKQRTWFSRNKKITWMLKDEIVDFCLKQIV